MPDFNIRVYGILTNDLGQVLISDEFRFGHAFTKFPGGGLEFGEGLSDALKREFSEEFQLDIEVEKLFYVNDFFQASKFNDQHQLISFYYLVSHPNWTTISVKSNTHPLTSEGEALRWIDISSLSESMMTFPIDKIVATRLKNQLD